ncbi:hypothetical protein G7Y79_00014g036970 [Physcia stellaris]|nr:hypothetical protein G7Y79_00014g036970 [Physcia stellaris]
MSPPQNRDLPPLRDSIGLLSDYIAVCSTTLILEETASDYDFDISDRKTGEKVFTVKGKADSQTISKAVLDTEGHEVFALRKDNTRIPKNHRLEAPDGSPFMAVEWSWGPTAHFAARFPNTTSPNQDAVEMTMDANYFRRNGDWKIDNQVVAHVFRDAWTAKDMIRGRRTYYLTVAPGMDIAAAVAACLYVHERVNEGGGTGRGSGTTAAIAGAIGGA